MIVQRIERMKRKQECVLVYLEGEAPLRITEDELLHFGLYTGLDISAETVVELRKHAARSETRRRAAEMVSARPLSRKELTKRLRAKGSSEPDAETAADWLEEIGALDEAAYAGTVVRHYSAAGYGAGKIRDELFRRGVPKELWDEALEQAPPAEETIARVIAERTKGRQPDEKGLQKLSGMLLRRGFPWDAVRSALSALGAGIEED